jgi:hypothetical protein
MVRELTDQAIPSISDPGGRLGPYVDAGDADLRNMQQYLLADLKDGEVVLLVSDSVVRNTDVTVLPLLPTVTGLAPFVLRAIEQTTQELKDYMTQNTTVKVLFSCSVLFCSSLSSL